MVALPPVPQVLRVGFSGLINSSPWMVTQHFQYTGTSLDTTGLNAMCANWAGAWDTNFKMLYPTGTSLRTCEAWDLTSPAGAYGSYTGNYPGTLIGGGLANSTALCISWKVNYRWRGGHPRSYLPPPTSAETTGGKDWSTTFQATASNQASLYMTQINSSASAGTTFKMVAVRYYSEGQLLPNPLVLLIALPLVHSRIDTQRRRLGKEIA